MVHIKIKKRSRKRIAYDTRRSAPTPPVLPERGRPGENTALTPVQLFLEIEARSLNDEPRPKRSEVDTETAPMDFSKQKVE